MILDVFINFAKASRKKEETLLPKKYEFMKDNKEKIEFVASFLVKAEVARELSAGFGIEHEEIESLWNDLAKSLDCKIIESFNFDAKIADFASRAKMKLRTLFNFMHIFIAVENDCYFVSGDKDLIEKIKLLMNYEKAIDYVEFRKLVEDGI